MVIPLKPGEEPAQICPGDELIQQGGGGVINTCRKVPLSGVGQTDPHAFNTIHLQIFRSGCMVTGRVAL